MDRFAVIEFEDYPDEWTRVRLGGVSVREFGDVIEKFNEAVVRYMPEPIAALCEAFGPFIDSWSYPEEPGAEGLREREPGLVFAIVRSWVRGVRDVPLPLPRRSSDGDPSEDPTTSQPT